MSRYAFLLKPKEWWRGIVTCIGTVGTFYLITDHVHVVINRTDSLPHKVFLHFPKQKPKKGDYTLVQSPWYQGRLIKRIVGRQGDSISYNPEGALFVDNISIGPQKSVAKDGRALTPISAQIISEGYVFLHATHKDSFDSRYQELGLISESDLQGRAIPVV